MKYDAMYFLKKFDAIPEDRWTTGTFIDNQGRRCATGHCLTRIGKIGKEFQALRLLLRTLDNHDAVSINDGRNGGHSFGDTPKERIMNALLMINAGVRI